MERKSKTGRMIVIFFCGIIIGIFATIMVMKMMDKTPDDQPKETVQQTIPLDTEETFDDSTPDDPIPTDETNIQVIKVNDSGVTMQEINIYLYQLRDFYTSQYGESPWNTPMENGQKLHEYAKDELYNGLIRTEILISKADEYHAALTEEEKTQCANEASAYIHDLGPAIAKDFALTEEGVRIMKEKQMLSTKVYNAAIDQIAETAEDTSDAALAKAFEEQYEAWKGSYTITTDAIWDNIIIGSVG